MNEAIRRIRTYGFRIDRSGNVYAYAEQPHRGRVVDRHQLYVGTVTRVTGGWRNDASADIHPTQTAAAQRLVAIICG